MITGKSTESNGIVVEGSAKWMIERGRSENSKTENNLDRCHYVTHDTKSQHKHFSRAQPGHGVTYLVLLINDNQPEVEVDAPNSLFVFIYLRKRLKSKVGTKNMIMD